MKVTKSALEDEISRLEDQLNDSQFQRRQLKSQNEDLREKVKSLEHVKRSVENVREALAAIKATNCGMMMEYRAILDSYKYSGDGRDKPELPKKPIDRLYDTITHIEGILSRDVPRDDYPFG